MKELRQITVIGLGLLGASLSLAISRTLNGVKSVGFSHRASTRSKARKLGVAHEICDDIQSAVANADVVVLATPISAFQEIFEAIKDALPAGCIVTDVGSTKVMPHKWAQDTLPTKVSFVGSHPIAGSEQRGIEFARDDMFAGTDCILTITKKGNNSSLQTLKDFWSALGCRVTVMDPVKHDRLLANISHLPHVTAASLLNANSRSDLKMAGKGFIDTSRVASGPANIWSDILVTNAENICYSIEKLKNQLDKLQIAIRKKNKKQIEKLLESARMRRTELIEHKLKQKEIL